MSSCFEGPNLSILVAVATAMAGTIAYLFKTYRDGQAAAFAAYREVQEARIRELRDLAYGGNALARRATEATAALAETERGRQP